MSSSLHLPSDDANLAEVEAVLQAFQDGYTHRDTEQLDAFMALFIDDDALEVIGTGAAKPESGEWCMGTEAVRRLIDSDWRYWGNLRLDIANAHIHALGDVAWLATAGTVTDRIERGPSYERYVDYAKEVLDQDATAEMKMLELIRTGTHSLYELAQGEHFVWTIRFTAVLVRRPQGWRFHRMQFSFPTTRYPDVRQEAPF